jgi:hypothetical protein
MERNIITEEEVKKALNAILNEEISKVSRQDFSRAQFKIEELENSLNETIKEFRKLETSIPFGLKNVTNKRIYTISSYLIGAQGNIIKLKSIVKSYKRKFYYQQKDPVLHEIPTEIPVDEKKK